MDQELIIVGKILKTHGLRGVLKIALLTDHPNRFQGLKTVILETRNGVQKVCTLASVQEGEKWALISCKEISFREEAASFLEGWVKIPCSELVQLTENQFYQFDLIGMSVFFEDNSFLGILDEILETGGNDIFIVRHEMKEYLIPAIRQVVKGVNIPKKRMVIHRMEGLVEGDAV